MSYEQDAFAAIANDLPNGLHDAELVGVSIDLERRELLLTLRADISEADKGETRSRFRSCSILVSRLEFVSVDPLRPAVDALADRAIDTGILDGERLTAVHPTPLPEGCFAYWLFLNGPNCFVRFAAWGADFRWLE